MLEDTFQWKMRRALTLSKLEWTKLVSPIKYILLGQVLSAPLYITHLAILKDSTSLVEKHFADMFQHFHSCTKLELLKIAASGTSYEIAMRQLLLDKLLTSSPVCNILIGFSCGVLTSVFNLLCYSSAIISANLNMINATSYVTTLHNTARNCMLYMGIKGGFLGVLHMTIITYGFDILLRMKEKRVMKPVVKDFQFTDKILQRVKSEKDAKLHKDYYYRHTAGVIMPIIIISLPCAIVEVIGDKLIVSKSFKNLPTLLSKAGLFTLMISYTKHTLLLGIILCSYYYYKK